ncbi:hypothetical protein TRVL_06693 [Trypanosoma vivax]|nr:hypothetical protein TRVL_06693 [Trypanosoma vivax]
MPMRCDCAFSTCCAFFASVQTPVFSCSSLSLSRGNDLCHCSQCALCVRNSGDSFLQLLSRVVGTAESTASVHCHASVFAVTWPCTPSTRQPDVFGITCDFVSSIIGVTSDLFATTLA